MSLSRRLKRAKEKAQQRLAAKTKAGEASGAWEEGEPEDPQATAVDRALAGASDGPALDRITAGDELESAATLRANFRVRSFDFAPAMSRDRRSSRILVALHNNSMEVWGLEGLNLSKAAMVSVGEEGTGAPARGSKSKEAEEEGAASCSRLAILDMQGHRSDVRAVAVSSDGTMVASVSHGLAKVWNSRSRQCVRSSPCGFGLAVAFAPGDRHLLVGTKEGNLQVRSCRDSRRTQTGRRGWRGGLHSRM